MRGLVHRHRDVVPLAILDARSGTAVERLVLRDHLPRRIPTGPQETETRRRLAVAGLDDLERRGTGIGGGTGQRLADETMPVAPFPRLEEELDGEGLKIKLLLGIVGVDRRALLVVRRHGGAIFVEDGGRDVDRQRIGLDGPEGRVLKHDSRLEGRRRHRQILRVATVVRMRAVADLSVEFVRRTRDVGERRFGRDHAVRRIVRHVVPHHGLRRSGDDNRRHRSKQNAFQSLISIISTKSTFSLCARPGRRSK